ncbi:flagellar hook-length control protein FliK [Vreelandella sp. EE27]
MSGITPLIDTLMHQVLGRQSDSLQRSINAPVQPVTPGDGPRALSRDSSLDGRPTTNLPLDDLRRLPASPDQGGRGLPASKGEGAPGSTQTHFSPAARSIADVLLRFPAPPTAVRLDAPLMGPDEPASAETLSNRLNASIRDSGLFYEAHLKRWFQGEVPRQQLMREPQMQLARPQVSGPLPAGPQTQPGTLQPSGPLSAGQQVQPGALQSPGPLPAGPSMQSGALQPSGPLPAGPQIQPGVYQSTGQLSAGPQAQPGAYPSSAQTSADPQTSFVRPLVASQAPSWGAFPGSGTPGPILPNTALVFVQGAAGGVGVPGPSTAPAAQAAANLPGASAGAGGANTSAGVAPGLASERAGVERSVGSLATTPSPLTEKPEARALAARETAALREFEALSSTKREVVHESLQGLVRQQLEMLATPVLRWEGDVWAGIFMALVINLPTGRQQGDEGGEGAEAEQEWRSQMQLEVPNVGAFSVTLSLFRSVLDVSVDTFDEETYAHLAPSIGRLEERLGALDFQKVRVNLKQPQGET